MAKYFGIIAAILLIGYAVSVTAAQGEVRDSKAACKKALAGPPY
jgi:hypothetical protein